MNHRLNPHPILWPENTQDTLSSWKKNNFPAPSHTLNQPCLGPKKQRGLKPTRVPENPMLQEPLSFHWCQTMAIKWSENFWLFDGPRPGEPWEIPGSHRTAWWLGVPIVVGNQSRGVFNVWVQTKLWLSHDYFILVFPSCYWCKSPWCS